MPKAMDIEEIIKTDHLFHPMRQLQRRSSAILFKSSRNQKTDKWCLSLNHVESCFRMLRSTSLDSEPDDACFFFVQVKRYHLNPFNCCFRVA